MRLLKQLWNDERGFVNSAELILIATLAVIGLIVGLATFRDAVFQELADTGAAVGQVNQSYSVFVGNSTNQVATDGPAITGTPNGPVQILRDFTNADDEVVVSVTAGFNNFQYEDEPDQGDVQFDPTLPPGIVSIGGTTDEGEDLVP